MTGGGLNPIAEVGIVLRVTCLDGTVAETTIPRIDINPSDDRHEARLETKNYISPMYYESTTWPMSALGGIDMLSIMIKGRPIADEETGHWATTTSISPTTGAES